MTESRHPWVNWAGNQHAHPTSIVRPRSIDEVCSLVADAARRGQRVKAIGAGHSFSGIAAPVDIQISLDNFRGLIGADRQRRRVTLGAGTYLHEVPAILAPLGLAMENLGDIDRQTLAGAISTGTHGSGAGFGGLSTQVVAMTLVAGDGSVLFIDGDEDPDLLAGAALGLGALGIIVEVTLRCVTAFAVRALERNESIDDVLATLLDRSLVSDHLDAYWFPHTKRAFVKAGARLPPGSTVSPQSRSRQWFDDEFLGNRMFGMLCRLGWAAPDLVPRINAITSGGVAQRSYSDRSDRVFVTERGVRFVEQEYALPAEVLPEAVDHVRSLIERRDWKITFPVELRFAAADEVWMSTAHGRYSGYLAVHRYYREPFEEYFSAVEEICVALGGRPHWGKFHTQSVDTLRRSYPRFDDFVSLRDRLDPARVFTNDYLDRVLGA